MLRRCRSLGWGWLVRVNEQVEVRRPPTRMETVAEQRLAWLEQIARAGTRDCLKANGIKRVWPGEEANDSYAAPLPGNWGGSHCIGVQFLCEKD